MASEAPPFWWERRTGAPGAVAAVRDLRRSSPAAACARRAREKIDAPVLCVGNFTVGGTGKTPVAIALARQARRMQLQSRLPVARPWRQLSRSRMSSMPHHDSARHVGDEPLLLAEHAPVAVTPNRAAGAAAADRAAAIS